MPELFAPILFLHVLGAIVALGPSFAFPMIGAMGGREPRHANFATRLTHLLSTRLVDPLILSTAVTGVGLIRARSIPVLAQSYRWLLLSIAVYVAAFAFSWFVQRPTILRVIELTAEPRPAPALASPSGPPPELMRAVARSRRNGLVLALLSLALVFLMVVKPSLPL
ncbi:MAG TPA: DUF2269 family protein [Candidatus Limnocylindrales bacterium]|nr:DUF2269 family protein [Candidatus Limnocylindrales bacterium]